MVFDYALIKIDKDSEENNLKTLQAAIYGFYKR